MCAQETIQIGGVPEHFFYPWKKWLKESHRSKMDFNWVWTDYPGGSGAMLQALEAREIDFAFLLTESAAFAQSAHLPIQPLSIFVKSPLQWGIFTGSHNPLESVPPVDKRTYAISRFGSGSHLMAMVDAYNRNEKIEENQWRVIQNLAGAENALKNLEADLYFWEKWTTKPLVDRGVFKMVDVCPSPWPSFVLVARSGVVNDETRMNAVKQAFSEVLALAHKLKSDPDGSKEISESYGLAHSDAFDWLNQVEWVDSWNNPEADIKKASDFLKKMGL